METKHTDSVLDNELQPYDQRDLVEGRIRPLLAQVHAICDANNIPFIALVCAQVDKGGTHLINRSVAFNGPQYVPLEMAAVNALIEEGPEAALPLIVSLLVGKPVDIEIQAAGGDDAVIVPVLSKKDLH